jgi:hypothetical protein
MPEHCVAARHGAGDLAGQLCLSGSSTMPEACPSISVCTAGASNKLSPADVPCKHQHRQRLLSCCCCASQGTMDPKIRRKSVGPGADAAPSRNAGPTPALQVVGFHVEGSSPSPGQPSVLADHSPPPGAGSPTPVIIPPAFSNQVWCGSQELSWAEPNPDHCRQPPPFFPFSLR